MTKEASKMLTDANLPHDDDLLGLIVSDDADATKQAVAVITNFASLIKKENARQTPPNEGGQFTASKNTKETGRMTPSFFAVIVACIHLGLDV